MSIIFDANSSGTLIVISSIGSHFSPLISLYITCGCPTCNSYPSRRIVSMSTERCSTPRPLTTHLSVESSNCLTLNARFFSSSFCRRSLIWRDVTNLPSRPKNGESLMVKSIDIVGSSMAIGGRGSGFSKSQIVSPISNLSRPIMAQMSPLCTSDTFFRLIPSKTCNSLIFVFSIFPSRCEIDMFCPSASTPRCTLPTAIRPV